ncbi:MAG: ATP-binding protein [Candidatus Nanopelagicales bacterium]
MDIVANPYTPGAGTRPNELVGRASQIAAFDTAIARGELRRSVQGKVLYGLRGVGKTVLLRELCAHARARHWIVVAVEASPGRPLLPMLTREIFKELRNAERTWSAATLEWTRRVFKSFSVKADPHTGSYTFGVDLEPAAGWADSGQLDRDLAEMLHELARLAGEQGVGLLLAFDELQEVEPPTLVAINATVHGLGQDADPLPFLMIGAGLPSLQGILAEATSYAERLYEYWEVDRLDGPATATALAGPAAELGVDWEPAALQRACDFSAGYPYFIQLIGQHAWNLALGPHITGADVEFAIADAQQEIDAGLYSSRWQRATPAEQRLLQAMARCAPAGGPAKMADLVVAMGKQKISQLSPARSNLIAKGLVYAPDRGELAFTVPGMEEFAARQVLA